MKTLHGFARKGWVTLAAALLLSVGIAGCEGDDGKDGATGQAGPAGPAGPASRARLTHRVALRGAAAAPDRPPGTLPWGRSRLKRG